MEQGVGGEVGVSVCVCGGGGRRGACQSPHWAMNAGAPCDLLFSRPLPPAGGGGAGGLPRDALGARGGAALVLLGGLGTSESALGGLAAPEAVPRAIRETRLDRPVRHQASRTHIIALPEVPPGGVYRARTRGPVCPLAHLRHSQAIGLAGTCVRAGLVTRCCRKDCKNLLGCCCHVLVTVSLASQSLSGPAPGALDVPIQLRLFLREVSYPVHQSLDAVNGKIHVQGTQVVCQPPRCMGAHILRCGMCQWVHHCKATCGHALRMHPLAHGRPPLSSAA